MAHGDCLFGQSLANQSFAQDSFFQQLAQTTPLLIGMVAAGEGAAAS